MFCCGLQRCLCSTHKRFNYSPSLLVHRAAGTKYSAIGAVCVSTCLESIWRWKADEPSAETKAQGPRLFLAKNIVETDICICLRHGSVWEVSAAGQHANRKLFQLYGKKNWIADLVMVCEIFSKFAGRKKKKTIYEGHKVNGDVPLC